MYKGASLFFCQTESLLTGLIIHISKQHDLCAQSLGTVHLNQRSRGGHDDGGLAAELLCRQCNTLRMVSGRCGNDAACAFFVRQLANSVVCPTNFICAGSLHVFRFQIDFVAALIGKVVAVDQLGRNRNLFDLLAGFFKSRKRQKVLVILCHSNFLLFSYSPLSIRTWCCR